MQNYSKKHTSIIKALLITGAALTFSSFSIPDKHAKYIEKHALLAQILSLTHGVPASVQLAQALIESGGGESYISNNSRNHFGIKYYRDWSGQSFEDRRGVRWRCYESVLHGYIDHAQFIAKHYSQTTYKSFDKWQYLGGYGGSGYWKKVHNTILKYNLQDYDLY